MKKLLNYVEPEMKVEKIERKDVLTASDNTNLRGLDRQLDGVEGEAGINFNNIS